MDFRESTEAYVATWHGIKSPNAAASRMAADLASIIEAFEAVRARMRFEDEPANFDAVLRECKE